MSNVTNKREFNRREFFRNWGGGIAIVGVGIPLAALAVKEAVKARRIARGLTPYETIEMQLGEEYKIGFGWFTYCGFSPEEKTFSMSRRIGGLLSSSEKTIQYPTSIDDFTLDDYRFKLDHVEPTKLVVKYLGER